MVKYIYIAVFFLLTGCAGDRKDDCIRSKGDVVDVSRTEEKSFSKISVEDRIKLILIQDSTRRGEMSLRGPENLLGQITSTIEDGFLKLRNDNTCNFVRSFDYEIVVTLYIDELDYLQIESIAEVSCLDTIFVDKLDIEHNALSDIRMLLGGGEVFVRSRNSSSTVLTGRVNKLKGSIEDVSELDAGGLICGEALVDTHTPLDCFLYAQKGLFVNIYNDGDIYQEGEPTEYSGVGENVGKGKLIIK